MRVVIDLAGSGGRWGAEDGGFGDGASIEDCGEVVLRFGAAEVRMSYPQFDKFMDNMLRWRWSDRPENQADLNADNPPPSWEFHRHAVETEIEDERRSIAVGLEQDARNHGLLPSPEKGDKLALRWFLAGRGHGHRDGLLGAAKSIRDRSDKLNLVGRKTDEKV